MIRCVMMTSIVDTQYMGMADPDFKGLVKRNRRAGRERSKPQFHESETHNAGIPHKTHVD